MQSAHLLFAPLLFAVSTFVVRNFVVRKVHVGRVMSLVSLLHVFSFSVSFSVACL